MRHHHHGDVDCHEIRDEEENGSRPPYIPESPGETHHRNCAANHYDGGQNVNRRNDELIYHDVRNRNWNTIDHFPPYHAEWQRAQNGSREGQYDCVVCFEDLPPAHLSFPPK